MAKASKSKSSTVKVGNTTVKGANAADRQAIDAAKAANRAEAEGKVQVTKPGDETPEAKATPAEKKKAAAKMFSDADAAVARGLSPDITVEQYETSQRRGVLGY
jgi:hypothetical protein